MNDMTQASDVQYACNAVHSDCGDEVRYLCPAQRIVLLGTHLAAYVELVAQVRGLLLPVLTHDIVIHYGKEGLETNAQRCIKVAARACKVGAEPCAHYR